MIGAPQKRGLRPGRKSPLFALVLAVAFLCLPSSPRAASDTPYIDSLRRELINLERRLENLRDQRREKTAEMDSLAARIDELKEQQKQDPGLLLRLRLERLLAESLEVSKVLDAIELKIRALETNVQTKRGTIVAEFDRELEKTFAELKEEKDRRKSAKLLRKYIRLKHRKKAVGIESSAPLEVELIDIRADPLDSPEELLDKAELIGDFVNKLSVLLSEVEERIEAIKREMELNQEMNLLIEENALFEDGTIFDATPRTLPLPEEEPDVSPPPDDTTVPDAHDDGAGVHTTPLVGFRDLLFSEEFQNATLTEELNRLKAEREFLLRSMKRLREREEELRNMAHKLMGKEKR